MKKLLLSLVALICITLSVDAQSDKGLNLTPRDTLLFEYMDTYRRQLREPQYQLFPTLKPNGYTTIMIWLISTSSNDIRPNQLPKAFYSKNAMAL